MVQIVKMQQVVIEDREEQERLRQQEKLDRTAAKVRSVQERVDSSTISCQIPDKLITPH